MERDYRFEKSNPDYLPESYLCEECGDYVDIEHIYETESGNLCPDCYNKMLDEILHEGGEDE